MYENANDFPLEVDFMMPVSSEFTLQKICVTFIQDDGTTTSVETKIEERTFAKVKYDDAVASGKTAVFSEMPKMHKNSRQEMIRVCVGNLPPKSKAFLRCFCS